MSFRFLAVFGFLCLLTLTSCEQKNKNYDDLKIFFVSVKGQELEVKPLLRSVSKTSDKLKESINLLLQGPSTKEQKRGFGTEIPSGTRLISVSDLPDRVNINLSQEFAIGGGSQSMQLRYKQINQTLVSLGVQKPIYIQIDGKDLQTIGGEGLIIDNPIQASNTQKTGDVL